MEEQIADLYRQPPDDFVAARDALVKALRAAGDKEGAAEVKALRKPSVAAWSLNQVAHASPALIESLLDAGENLRSAQDDAIGGGGGDALRDAMRARRAAVKQVADAAAGALTGAGRSAAGQANVIGATLEATATDAALAAALREGRLVAEAQPMDDDLFGFGAVDAPAGAKPASTKAKKAAPPAPKVDAKKLAAARKLLAAATTAAERAVAARQEADDAVDEAERYFADLRLAAADATKAATAALQEQERCAAAVTKLEHP